MQNHRGSQRRRQERRENKRVERTLLTDIKRAARRPRARHGRDRAHGEHAGRRLGAQRVGAGR